MALDVETRTGVCGWSLDEHASDRLKERAAPEASPVHRGEGVVALPGSPPRLWTASIGQTPRPARSRAPRSRCRCRASRKNCRSGAEAHPGATPAPRSPGRSRGSRRRADGERMARYRAQKHPQMGGQPTERRRPLPLAIGLLVFEVVLDLCIQGHVEVGSASAASTSHPGTACAAPRSGSPRSRGPPPGREDRPQPTPLGSTSSPTGPPGAAPRTPPSPPSTPGCRPPRTPTPLGHPHPHRRTGSPSAPPGPSPPGSAEEPSPPHRSRPSANPGSGGSAPCPAAPEPHCRPHRRTDPSAPPRARRPAGRQGSAEEQTQSLSGATTDGPGSHLWVRSPPPIRSPFAMTIPTPQARKRRTSTTPRVGPLQGIKVGPVQVDDPK